MDVRKILEYFSLFFLHHCQIFLLVLSINIQKCYIFCQKTRWNILASFPCQANIPDFRIFRYLHCKTRKIVSSFHTVVKWQLKGTVHPKKENSVIMFSPSSCFKLAFFCESQGKILQECFLNCDFFVCNKSEWCSRLSFVLNDEIKVIQVTQQNKGE